MTTPARATAAGPAAPPSRPSGLPGPAGRAAAPGRTRPALALTLLHLRFQVLETLRVPVAVLGFLLFPSLSYAFFVLPQAAVRTDPAAATGATVQLAVFAIMSTCLFTFGAGVAEDRQKPFDPYLRTLPAGAGPRLGGRVLNGVLWSYLSVLPLVLLALVATAARLSPGRALLAAGLVPLVAVPFLLLGLAIGYRLTAKAALPVVQATLFPLAFAGGLFLPPQLFPGWLDALSRALPSRALRDLAVHLTGGPVAPGTTAPVLLAWTALFAALAVAAVRAD
ncbi:ABC transporter permease, partial [Cellulomonas endophytica]|uniref:ABC transporter permease n=1 Tax=Cellulomonas endophytica TaxID=2494735 RepID=UPI001012491B